MSELDDALNFVSDNATVDEPFLAQYARAELAQLRATVAAQAERIAWLTSDIGESGLDAINRLIAACERGDGIDQHCAPDLSIARDEIVRQAEQLEEARDIINHYTHCDMTEGCQMHADARAWLTENAPAPQAQPQEEQSA